MSDDFKARRTLMHQIVEIWKEMYGDWWIVKAGQNELYFDHVCDTELQARETLMSYSYSRLDSIAMSAMLTMEMK